MKISVLPLWPDVPNNVLNSLWSVNKMLFQKIWYRDGRNQYIEGINNSPINVLNQFNDKFMILEDGSNTENKFVIIFNLLC